MSLDPILDALMDLGLVEEQLLKAHAALWRDANPEAHGSAFLEVLVTDGLLTTRQVLALQRMLPPDPSQADTVSLPPDPHVGQRFGDYVARERLAAGGMGVVYLADRPGDDTRYVIKLFHADDDPESAKRIAREAELMRPLDHPNIVRMHASGEARGQPYLVLEHVDGETLHARLVDRRKLPWASASRAAEQIAEALRVAHQAGIVHRDVKPQNLLIDRQGTIKLADFGIAKALDPDGIRSRAGQILGSPAYIAPEQWGDHDVDERVDLFALGVLYYQLLTGVTPFRGRSPSELALRIQAGEYDAIERLAPDVPIGVRWLVRQLLERDRRYRTPSASAMLAELQRVLRGQRPDVPRLEPELPGPETVALLGGPLFVVGSGPGCHVTLTHPSVAPQHAQLERRTAGLLLRRVVPDAEVTVNDQQLGDSVILKADDVVRFGGLPAWRYHPGNLAKQSSPWDSTASGEFAAAAPDIDTACLQPLVVQPHVVPGILAAALEDGGDPRALLLCIESLDSRGNAWRLQRSRRDAEAAGVDPATCAAAHQRARGLLAQRASWLADQLYHVTHENLGEDAIAWVDWWLESRHRYEVQVRPPLTPPGGSLLLWGQSLAEPRRHALDDADGWTIGRSLQADISVADRSLSRMHVRIVRLIDRLAFRDLGSRLGVRQDGIRSEVGLLRPGQTLLLGNVQLRWDPLPPPNLQDAPAIPVDRATFTALVGLRSPSTIRSLINLLDPGRLRRACAEAVAKLGLDLAVDALVDPFLESHRRLALEGLPPITRANHGDDVAAWRTWWRQHHASAPPQVTPAGWGC